MQTGTRDAQANANKLADQGEDRAEKGWLPWPYPTRTGHHFPKAGDRSNSWFVFRFPKTGERYAKEPIFCLIGNSTRVCVSGGHHTEKQTQVHRLSVTLSLAPHRRVALKSLFSL